MAIASFRKKRSSFDYNIKDEGTGDLVTFTLYPLPSDLDQMVSAFIMGGNQILSQSQKLRFVKECIVSWSGLVDEDGAEVKHSQEAAISLIHPDYDDLVTELVVASYQERREYDKRLQETLENLGK